MTIPHNFNSITVEEVRRHFLAPAMTAWRCNCRGRLLRSICDFAAAEEDFERILELKPTHKGAAKELGLLQQGREALEQAVASKYV